MQAQIFKKVQKSFKKITDHHILRYVRMPVLYLVAGHFRLFLCFQYTFPGFQNVKKI